MRIPPLFCLLLLLAFSTRTSAAQGPPGTDVWLISMPSSPEALQPDGAVNVTGRAGYDNQPSFTPDGASLLYTSQRGEQTDIYRYDLATGEAHRVTDTPESEYSPLVMPGGAAFSTVRVEADGTQRLWAFGLDGANPRLVLADVAPVGYHAWGDARTLVLFVLGDPPTLQQADTETGTAVIRAQHIGRALHPVPGRHAVSFVHKPAEEDWVIRQLALDSGDVTDLAPALPGREDYAWLPDGTLLMGDGGKLYRTTPGNGGWEPFADFTALGITNITRLAVSPAGDRLAFVADE